MNYKSKPQGDITSQPTMATFERQTKTGTDKKDVQKLKPSQATNRNMK